MNGGQPLRIGSLARAAGVGIETIRYYQRRELLGQPDRQYGSQRSYPPEYVERVRFIKRAQALGFSLDEIAELMTLDRGTGHARARALATRRLAEIERKLTDLVVIRDTLRKLVHDCERSHGKVACPIVTALASEPAETAATARRPRVSRPAARSGRTSSAHV